MSTTVLFNALDILSSASVEIDAKENVVQRLSTNLTRVKDFLKDQGEYGGDLCGKVRKASSGSGFHETSYSSSSEHFVDEFLLVSLEILDQLCQVSDSDTLWSVKEEATLKRCLQLVVVLGVLPHLHRNIGVPLHRRTATGVQFADFEAEVGLRERKRK